MIKRVANAVTKDKNITLVEGGSSALSSSAFSFADILVILIGVVFYIVVARVWQPLYIVKSAAKAIAFIVLPIAVSWIYGHHDLSWIKLSMGNEKVRRALLKMLLISALAVAIFVMISGPLGEFFRVEQIMAEVKGRTRVARPLVVASAFYIAVVNSLIEELYFRGYLLLKMKARLGFKPATITSALLFSLYHLIVFRNWFNVPLAILILSLLMLAGLILNSIVERYNSLLPAWLLHGLMNIAIFAVALPYF